MPYSPEEIQKAIRLVNYLTRLTRLRSGLIHGIKQYEKVLWIGSIPHEKECFTQAWGHEEEEEPDEWLKVKSRREPEPPAIPVLCREWVDRNTLRNKNDNPELLREITRQIQNPDGHEEPDQPEIISITEHLGEHPEVQQAWESYVEDEWLQWTKKHNAWEEIHKVYSKLFAIRQAQLRLGEEYELVLGLGLLTWQTPTGQRVRRHLVVADAMLEFEAQQGKFTVRPHTEGAKLRPELDMLAIEEQPILARDSLNNADDNPWNNDCVRGVLQTLVHSINAQGQYTDTLQTEDIRASENPIVEYAPALILRKRSDKGLTVNLDKNRETDQRHGRYS